MADEQVQRSATVQQIVDDHMAGVSGYDIADKYGMDTEKVKEIIQKANDEGKFIPDGTKPSADFADAPKPLKEGENPKVEPETTSNKK